MSTLHGPLRRHPVNGRYFTDDTGDPIYLTGSHNWENLQDIGRPGMTPFPYDEYLDFMQSLNHNFMRLWMFEQPEAACWTPEQLIFTPLPWERTGPGAANDGLPKFDLSVWNEAYFARLRQRIIAAGERGIYTAIMLFQGWSLNVTRSKVDPWVYHPFNSDNNLNDVETPHPAWADDQHSILHSTLNPKILAFQEAYVRKVVDTVNDLDNVLYEIINEGGAWAWQVHMTDFIHRDEQTRFRQHPVGITAGPPTVTNARLYGSPADWISPGTAPNWGDHSPLVEDFREDPPPADGSKVCLPDTDHLWGHGGNWKWAWKCFLRGHNPIFMDPWQGLYLGSTEDITPWVFSGGIPKDDRDYPDWEPLRRAMGDTHRYARRMNLAAMTPRPELASSRYCLANPGEEYLIYLPAGGSLTVNLCNVTGNYAVEWFLPPLNRTLNRPIPLAGGDYRVISAPFSGDAVLYLKRID